MTIKLHSSNYPVWKAQVVPYFCGHDLYGYLDGTIPIPLKEIDISDSTTGTSQTIPNPLYNQWLRQDSLILATINSSLTEDVLTQVMSYTTSREVWLALENNFSSLSRAKVIQIRTQLANAKKGAMTANEFFLSVKRMADELALAGQPLPNDDIITYILAGLGQEYDSLASTISSRRDPVSLEELFSLLLICESRINHNNQPLLPSANLVTTSPQQFHRQTGTVQHSNRYRGHYRSRGRGGRSHFHDSTHSSSLICQVCLKPGHSARKCYHRFDLSYQAPPHSKNQPQALLAAHYLQPYKEWHPDTGATHHLTNDVNNIQFSHANHDTQDHVQVANGAGLKIVRSGTSTLSSPSKSFTLNQILLVPDIQKNLLSVHRFCLDNNVFFEFHASFFIVKDYSGNTLHRGPLSNGLYNFSASLAHLQPQAFSSVRVSSQIWHRRLGHASFPVIHQAISLPSPNKNRPICSDCQLAKSHAMPFIKMHVAVSQPLELIYSDVWGPASTLSTSGARYYISFLDDATKCLWLFPLKLKSDAYQTFLSF